MTKMIVEDKSKLKKKIKDGVVYLQPLSACLCSAWISKIVEIRVRSKVHERSLKTEDGWHALDDIFSWKKECMIVVMP